MDHSRFDHLTKVLAAPSRRSFLRIAIAAALAALLGQDERETGAKPKKKKKCKKPKIKCNNKCVNPKDDEKNCGGCGNDCANGQTCVNGACAGGGCSGGLRDCGAAGCLECCPDENFGYCCPPERPTCWDDFGNEHFKRCSANGTCQCRDDQPDECLPNPGFPGVCWECCGDAACFENELYVAQGKLACRFNICNCPDDQKLCPNINPAPDEPGTWCTDTYSDPENCGDCGIRCIFGLATRCVEGQCVE
jgi:hypothetical protein